MTESIAHYLDNAATSFPKPEAVIRAMSAFMETEAANPGRSGHSMSVAAGREVYLARERLADLMGAGDPLRIAFMKNATEALNVAILSMLSGGGAVVTTSLEHNSVARPLRRLAAGKASIDLAILDGSGPGNIVTADDISAVLSTDTRLVVVTHASNVTGALNPIADIAAVCRDKGVPLLVDAAQTFGYIDIDVEGDGIDLLAFTGHKALYGPMGTGGLYVRPGIDLEPLMVGGTGSRSEEDVQPPFMPDSLESGTPNAVGIAGLRAGVDWLAEAKELGLPERKRALTETLYLACAAHPRLRVIGPGPGAERCGIVSVVPESMSNDELAARLDDEFGVAVRVGLQCSPWAHRALGTFPEGTVRFSLGLLNVEDDVEATLHALERILA